MGRIKTQRVKRYSKEAFTQNKEAFTTSFDENKKILTNFYEIPSKKLRNILAGYITRLAKQQD